MSEWDNRRQSISQDNQLDTGVMKRIIQDNSLEENGPARLASKAQPDVIYLCMATKKVKLLQLKGNKYTLASRHDW